MKVAVIPARGGSTRIPRKNIRPFCGKPMIAWSIGAALQSGCFGRVVVSTDDDEIAHVAHEHGAEIPFMRPAELADAWTGTQAVMAHAVRELALDEDDLACCLYATAPFVTAEDLQRGLKILKESGARFAFSVTSYASPIQRAFRVTDAGRIEMFQPECFHTRSQDLEDAWHDAGQFYWARATAWLGDEPVFSQISAPVLLPRHRAQDIDTEEDWIMAEQLFRLSHNEGEQA